MIDVNDKPATLQRAELRGSHSEDGEFLVDVRMKLSFDLTPQQMAALPDDVVKLSLEKDDATRSVYIEYMEELVEVHGATLGLSPTIKVDEYEATVTVTIDAAMPGGHLEALAGMVLVPVMLTLRSAQKSLGFDEHPAAELRERVGKFMSAELEQLPL